MSKKISHRTEPVEKNVKVVYGALSGKPSRIRQATPDSDIYKRGWTVGMFSGLRIPIGRREGKKAD